MRFWGAVGVWLAIAGAAGAGDVPRVIYSKSFPGSTPPFISIVLDKTGAGQYREAADDDNPLRFQLAAVECDEIFELVGKLESFKRPLESPAKVAFLGMKTFRFENGPEVGEVKFNFSEDPDARLLWDWFERITASEQLLINLERAAKYDKLGILKAILGLESEWDRKRLVAPQQFLPLLDRVVNNSSYMHTARVRAAAVADAIRAAK